jgi:hypothetical protein
MIQLIIGKYTIELVYFHRYLLYNIMNPIAVSIKTVSFGFGGFGGFGI